MTSIMKGSIVFFLIYPSPPQKVSFLDGPSSFNEVSIACTHPDQCFSLEHYPPKRIQNEFVCTDVLEITPLHRLDLRLSWSGRLGQDIFFSKVMKTTILTVEATNFFASPKKEKNGFESAFWAVVIRLRYIQARPQQQTKRSSKHIINLSNLVKLRISDDMYSLPARLHCGP